MEIALNKATDVVIVAERKKTIDKISVVQIVDSPSEKAVYAVSKELGRINLWIGDDYDKIGQWTDQDVVNKINEIYS